MYYKVRFYNVRNGELDMSREEYTHVDAKDFKEASDKAIGFVQFFGAALIGIEEATER